MKFSRLVAIPAIGLSAIVAVVLFNKYEKQLAWEEISEIHAIAIQLSIAGIVESEGKSEPPNFTAFSKEINEPKFEKCQIQASAIRCEKVWKYYSPVIFTWCDGRVIADAIPQNGALKIDVNTIKMIGSRCNPP